MGGCNLKSGTGSFLFFVFCFLFFVFCFCFFFVGFSSFSYSFHSGICLVVTGIICLSLCLVIHFERESFVNYEVNNTILVDRLGGK